MSSYGQTFSGFDWCLNRENLIVTYSKRSHYARFWDLIDDNPSSSLLTQEPKGEDHTKSQLGQSKNTDVAENETSKQNLLQAPNVLTEEYKILNCQSEIVSLAWKPRQSGQDRNKFVIYTSEGEICEHTFYERNYHVLDLSCKGEICISVQNPASQ